jgi:hypothetical protein
MGGFRFKLHKVYKAAGAAFCIPFSLFGEGRKKDIT